MGRLERKRFCRDVNQVCSFHQEFFIHSLLCVAGTQYITFLPFVAKSSDPSAVEAALPSAGHEAKTAATVTLPSAATFTGPTADSHLQPANAHPPHPVGEARIVKLPPSSLTVTTMAPIPAPPPSPRHVPWRASMI